MKVARFFYHHGCSLYIDNKYVGETDHMWYDESTDELDFKAMLGFLKEHGVTHVIDEESFEDNLDANGEWDPKPHPLQEYEDLLLKEEVV